MTKDFIITCEQVRTKPSWSDRELRLVSRALPFDSYTHLHIHFMHAYLFYTGASLAGPFRRHLSIFTSRSSPCSCVLNVFLLCKHDVTQAPAPNTPMDGRSTTF